MQQPDPYNFSSDGFLEQQPVCRRLRSNLRPTVPIMPGYKADEHKPNLEDDLLGRDGLGLSTEEFSNLQESEKKQLLEAVLQSKEDLKSTERKTEREKPISSPGSSNHRASTSSLLCSVPLQCLKLTSEPLGRISSRLSLERFRSASVVATEVIKDDAVATTSRNTASIENSDLGNWNKTTTVENKSEQNIPAAATRKELIWDQSYLSPVKPLIRKYRVQVVDKRPPFCRQKGSTKAEHFRMIWNYLSEMEALLCQQSRSTRTHLVPWGKPIPLEVAKNRQSARTRNHVRAVKNDVNYVEVESDENLAELDVNSTEQGQILALNTNEGRLNTNEGNLNTNEGRLNTNEGRLSANEGHLNANESRVSVSEGILNTSEHHFDQGSRVEARRSSVKAVDIVLDSRWKQEDLESRLQNSRQMKIGGGVAEEGPPKVQRKAVKRRTAKESDENSDSASTSKAKSRKQKKPGDRAKKNPRKNKNSTAEEVKDNNDTVAVEVSRQQASSAASRESSRLSGDAKPASQFPNHFEGDLEGGASKDQASGGLLKGNSYQENMEEGGSDEEFVIPPSPSTDADRRPQAEFLQSSAAPEKLGRPSIRDYLRKRKNEPWSSCGNSNFRSPGLHYDLFSDEEQFEDDGKKKERRIKPDPDFTVGKTSSKKQVKPGSEQLTMRSFSTSNSSSPKIPKLIQTCPMCQLEVSKSDYEGHVVDCVDRNDTQIRTRGTSRN